jgi:UDP:flavonoid glycosyltransferase YjiC (YdhE family)
MARIAFAWELGGELGHATGCAALAAGLRARGHETRFFFRELHQLRAIRSLAGAAVLQAPISPREGEGVGVPDSRPDILLGCGYADPAQLRGLVAGWLTLLRHARPDLVVADDAPTAILAARIERIPAVTFSNGFAIPPPVSPYPPFRVDVPADPARLAANEARVLASVNAVLDGFGLPPEAQLHRHFAVAEDFLCTFPEIDQYGNRPAARYWGPRFSVDIGAHARWPSGRGPRVLAYLRSSVAPIEALAAAWSARGCRLIACIPGMDDATRARLRRVHATLSDVPVRLAPLLRECDLFVSHGGNAAVAALMSGVPQLLLPTQYEQFLTALRIEQLGAGVQIPSSDAVQVDTRLGMALEWGPRLKAAAQAFVRRYAGFSPQEQQRRIVARIEEILVAGSTS